MDKLYRYIIDLKGMKGDQQIETIQLDDHFFSAIEATEIQKGNLTCVVEVSQNLGGYELTFHTEGFVIVQCDRCLDEMLLPVVAENRLNVKFGEENIDEGDDLIVVSEEEGVLDLAWHIYEFIVLALPIQHVHKLGECNEMMYEEYSKHLVSANDLDLDEEDTEDDDEFNANEERSEKASIDPRWEKLKDAFVTKGSAEN